MQKTILLRTTELAVMPLLHEESPKSGGKRVAFRGQEHATRKPPASVKTEIKNEYKQTAKALQSSTQQDGGGGGEAPGDEELVVVEASESKKTSDVRSGYQNKLV
ncbi:hypothetical protein BFJ67_g10367 [Fusarium oxysporum f. sp. cepae]|nr:hypothetical protein BFJ67_g10367 [Fusarium oxysporum f. sp. cepae]